MPTAQAVTGCGICAHQLSTEWFLPRCIKPSVPSKTGRKTAEDGFDVWLGTAWLDANSRCMQSCKVVIVQLRENLPCSSAFEQDTEPLFHTLYELPWPLAFIVNALWKVFRSLVVSFRHMHNTEVQRAKGATQRVNMEVFETDTQLCFCHPSCSTTHNFWLLSLEKNRRRTPKKRQPHFNR